MFFKDRPPAHKMLAAASSMWLFTMILAWILPAKTFNIWGWSGLGWLNTSAYITMVLIRSGFL